MTYEMHLEGLNNKHEVIKSAGKLLYYKWKSARLHVTILSSILRFHFLYELVIISLQCKKTLYKVNI